MKFKEIKLPHPFLKNQLILMLSLDRTLPDGKFRLIGSFLNYSKRKNIVTIKNIDDDKTIEISCAKSSKIRFFIPH